MLLGEIVRRNAKRWPDELAVVDADRRLTWRELRSRCDRLSATLQASSRPGDRVAVLLANRSEYLELYYGVPDAGLILVPLNYRLHPVEVAAQLRHCGAKMLITEAALLDPLAALLSSLDSLERVLVIGGDQGVEGHLAYEDVLDTAPAAPPPSPRDDTSTAWIVYTSGTTGRPRGVMLSHRNLLTSVLESVVEFGTAERERMLMTFPLCHVSAAATTLIGHLRGATIYLMRTFDAAAWLRDVERFAITESGLAPTMISYILDRPDIDDYELRSLRGVIYGTAVLPVPLVERFLDRFGPILYTAYGSSELAGPCTAFPKSMMTRAVKGEAHLLASCGRPALLCEVQVVDDDGQPLGAGAIGELLVKGDQVMSGYWDDPEHTAATISDGWLRTGDLVEQDQEGFLYVVGRKKDLIITGGENVYPRDVEEVLYSHPGIADAAVIGLPDEVWGERVTAVIVAREGHCVSEDEVVRLCRSRLAGYKTPRSVVILDTLPRNAAGKVLKAQLRESLG